MTVAFTPPAGNGGAAISLYRVTCIASRAREHKIGYSHRSPITVKGLAAGRSYSCTLAARNRKGFGPGSEPFGSTIKGATQCLTQAGTATFTPALPRLGDRTLVDSVLTLSGTIGSCTGGGVTSGTTEVVAAPVASNCTTLVAASQPAIVGTLTITWNTNATSTIALELQQVKGKPTQTLITGRVTAGLFKGMQETGTLTYTVPAGGCTTQDLSTLSYKNIEATLIG